MNEIFGTGIDVSQHNGVIDWDKVNKQIDFVIIRAGYGKNNIDKMAEQNVKSCQLRGIPYGLYWFSYALSPEMAKAESDYLCNFADKYKPTLPLFFDYEYDSDNYAKKQGVAISNADRKAMAYAFLENVERRGYFASIYSNVDYLHKGFNEVTKRFALWLAEWGVKSPSIACRYWQNTDKGRIDGIDGYVDVNTTYSTLPKNIVTKEIILGKAWNKYEQIAKDIIAGKYGNGEERKIKLKEQGYDYELAQSIVNYLI